MSSFKFTYLTSVKFWTKIDVLHKNYGSALNQNEDILWVSRNPRVNKHI